MTDIGIGYRDESSHQTHHWRELPATYRIDRPCVIIFGGNATQTARASNNYLKQVEQMAGVAGVPVKDRAFDMIAPYYKALSDDCNERALFLLQTEGASARMQWWHTQMKEQPELLKKWENPLYIQTLYKRLLQPLVSDKNGVERVSLEQASQNFRRINIVSHSHGAFVAAKIQDMADRDMGRLGYTQQERQRILSQIKWIDCAGDRVPFGWTKVDTVHFFAWVDEALYSNRHERSFSRMLEMQSKAFINGKNIVLPISKTENIWITERFGIPVSDMDNPDHAFDYFGRGAWMASNKTGREVAFMVSTLLQANISDSIQNEVCPTLQPKPWIERIGMPVCYPQGPHVIDSLSTGFQDDLSQKAQVPVPRYRVNMTSHRLSVAQKQTMLQNALQKGERLDSLPYILNFNASIRQEAADKLKTMPLPEKRQFVKEFHTKYSYFKSALMKTHR